MNKDKKINIKTVNVTVGSILNGALGMSLKTLVKKMRAPKN